MAKKATKRRAWTQEHVRTLKALARKKNTRGTDRQDAKAFRGRDAAKSI
jgi:hypothetical protein